MKLGIVFLSFFLIGALCAAAPIPSELTQQLQSKAEVEFFIVLNEKADLKPAKALNTKLEKGVFIYQQLTQTAERSQENVRTWLDQAGVRYQPFWIRNMILVTGNRSILEALAQRSDIQHIAPNSTFHALDPNEKEPTPDKGRGVEWNISRIRADKVWDKFQVNGEGIVVCGNDTGVKWDHPAIKNQYRGWSGSAVDHNYNWHDSTGVSPSQPLDDNNHGTHTMGTMIGDDGNTNKIGVAPGARWIAVKTIREENGSLASFHDGFQWILAPTDLNNQNPDPSKAPHVVNDSWRASYQEPLQFHEDIEALVAAGIYVTFAAGNDGPGCNTISIPAAYDNALAVGATSINGDVADFSSRGPTELYPDLTKPEIVAPGVNVRSCIPNGNYEAWNGTSMADPHSVGLIALIWSANPELIGNIEDTKTIITETAITGESIECSEQVTPNNAFGAGEIDCYRAVGRAIPAASAAIMFFNRELFGCADEMTICVKDSDMSGTGGQMISVTSNTESGGELIVLPETNPGVFIGTATLATGAPASDGILQVSENDTITALYVDVNHGGGGTVQVTEEATVDCSEPVISNVHQTAVHGSSAYIAWTTDEPTTTEVFYGTSLPVDKYLTFQRHILNHKALLNDLESCATYSYYVKATDEAGNTTIDDNGGQYYQFTTTRKIILIDENMDTRPNWTAEGGWEWGVPAGNAGDPTAGFTGSKVFGYNLSGAYPNNMSREFLTSPAYNFSDAVSVVVWLRLWLTVDKYSLDKAQIQFSVNGGANWLPLYSNPDWTMDEGYWMTIHQDVSGYVAGLPDVRFRWVMGPTDASVTFGGWNIDDVKVEIETACDVITPTPRPTASPTVTPSPTYNPPTPTAIPDLGVRLELPEMAHPGQIFYVTGYLDNPYQPLANVPVFFVLDVFGEFWFWPQWTYFHPPESTELDYDVRNVPTGSQEVVVVPEFTWPDTGLATVHELYFYGAMLTDDLTAVRGELAVNEFGYGPQ